jgi:hypothetical protein
VNPIFIHKEMTNVRVFGERTEKDMEGGDLLEGTK